MQSPWDWILCPSEKCPNSGPFGLRVLGMRPRFAGQMAEGKGKNVRAFGVLQDIGVKLDGFNPGFNVRAHKFLVRPATGWRGWCPGSRPA